MTDVTKTPQGKLALPTALYDAAKNTTTIYLPAASTLYITLAAIYGWPGAQEVAQTVVAVVLFLGVVLKISSTSYNNSDKSVDGTLHVDQSDPLTDKYVLDLGNSDLDAVAQQDKVTLKVNNTTPPDTKMDPRLIDNSQ